MKRCVISAWGRTPRDPAAILLAGVLAGALWSAPGWSIQVWMSDESGFGFHDGPYATNEVVYISGEWDQYDFPCPIGDVYMVPNSGSLWNATTGIGPYVAKKPVQGCGGAGAFYGAILKLPPLSLGEYDIVMDENQDGQYLYGTDYVLGAGASFAFKVIDQTLDQRVDVAGIKAKAAKEAHGWRVTAWGTKISLGCLSLASTALMTAQLIATTGSLAIGYGYAVVGAGSLFLPYATSYNGAVENVYGTLVWQAGLRTASVHQAVAADPPDGDYTSLVGPDSLVYEVEAGPQPYLACVARLCNRSQEEATLAAAFRQSYEKFLGAEAAADYYWARLQARAAKEYCDLLVGRLAATAAALDSLDAAIAASGWADKTWSADSTRTMQQRVVTQGFYPQELESMQAAGMDAAEIDSMRSHIINADLDGLETGSLGGWVDSLRAETASAVAHYDSVSADLTGVLQELANSWVSHPLAVMTGDTIVAEGGTVSLSGSSSTDPRSLPLAMAWDLDADGRFDDATGPAAAFSRSANGEYRVGLRVTNSDGLWDVTHRFIRVTEVNRMPGFTSTLPGAAYLRIARGASQTFNATVSDPDGDPVVARWSLDGVEVATGASWSYHPAAADVGRHHVQVRLGDGSPLSPDNFYVWRVDVQSRVSDLASESGAARGFWLAPGEPNPFRSRATLRFSVERAGQVNLSVYDAHGRRVARLVDASLGPGVYRATWDGSLADSRPAPPGVYFARLVVGARSATTRLTRIH